LIRVENPKDRMRKSHMMKKTNKHLANILIAGFTVGTAQGVLAQSGFSSLFHGVDCKSNCPFWNRKRPMPE
jgi:hypothetical protein